MSRHASVAVLSSYLDEELRGEELAKLESHLESCESCRQYLVDMRRVVSAVRGIERQAVPSVLGQRVVQRVEAYGRATSLMTRVEERLEKLRLDGSPFVTFALVLAFAVILIAFAHSIQRSQDVTRLVVLPQAQEFVLGTTVFERRPGAFVAEGLEREGAIALDPTSIEALEVRSRLPEIDGLLLELPVVLELTDGRVVEIQPLGEEPESDE